MFKSTFLAIMALVLCLSAQARTSYVRSHEDFVHLSDYEKNQMIIQTMELVVELESKYQYQVKKYGYSHDRYQKFQKAVSQISSILFINSAYAEVARPGDRLPGRTGQQLNPRVPHANRTFLNQTKTPMNNWSDFGSAFARLMAKPGENCIFAGWPSMPYVDKNDGKTYCAHPDFIQGTASNRHQTKAMTAWTKAYPDPKPGSGCDIDNRETIQCNPALFGYKKVDTANMANSTLFCVPSGNGAHNSAYHCMKEALKPSTNADSDAPEARLSFLRQQLSSNPAAVTALQEFVYKTCVCDQTPANFSQKYKEYIRPHRTCYGMMEMMSKVACGSPTPLNIETGVFESFQQYTKDKIFYNTNNDTSLGAVDSHYTNFITHVKAESVEYNILCNGAVRAEKEYECAASCKTLAPAAAGGAPTYDCTYVVKEKPSGTVVSITKPDVQPVAGNPKLDFSTTIANKTVPLSCDVTFVPADEVVVAPTNVCSKADCKTNPGVDGAAATVTCEISVASSAEGAPAVSFEPDASKFPAVGTPAGEFEFSGKIAGADTKIKCPMTLAALPVVVTPEVEEEEKKEYECKKAECIVKTPASAASSAAIAGVPATSTAATYTCNIEANEKGKTEKISLTGSPEGTPENGKDVAFKIDIEGKPADLTCKVTMTAAVVPPRIEPVAERPSLGGPAMQNQGPPRTQIRGSSDTSAVGIK